MTVSWIKQGPNFIVPLLNSNCFLSISIGTFSASYLKEKCSNWVLKRRMYYIAFGTAMHNLIIYNKQKCILSIWNVFDVIKVLTRMAELNIKFFFKTTKRRHNLRFKQDNSCIENLQSITRFQL